jgi:hypothetical protein
VELYLVFDHFNSNRKIQKGINLSSKPAKLKLTLMKYQGVRCYLIMSGADTLYHINKPTKLWVIRSTAGFVTWELAPGEKGYYYFLPL